MKYPFLGLNTLLSFKRMLDFFCFFVFFQKKVSMFKSLFINFWEKFQSYSSHITSKLNIKFKSAILKAIFNSFSFLSHLVYHFQEPRHLCVISRGWGNNQGVMLAQERPVHTNPQRPPEEPAILTCPSGIAKSGLVRQYGSRDMWLMASIHLKTGIYRI